MIAYLNSAIFRLLENYINIVEIPIGEVVTDIEYSMSAWVQTTEFSLNCAIVYEPYAAPTM